MVIIASVFSRVGNVLGAHISPWSLRRGQNMPSQHCPYFLHCACRMFGFIYQSHERAVEAPTPGIHAGDRGGEWAWRGGWSPQKGEFLLDLIRWRCFSSARRCCNAFYKFLYIAGRASHCRADGPRPHDCEVRSVVKCPRSTRRR